MAVKDIKWINGAPVLISSSGAVVTPVWEDGSIYVVHEQTISAPTGIIFGSLYGPLRGPI